VNNIIPVIVPDRFFGDVDTSVVPDRVPDVLRPNESVEPSAATDKNRSNWKSTASAAGKVLLLGVRDSADAFGPLKSVAGGLCVILENCEVRPPSHIRYPRRLRGYPSERRRTSK
jgi:hypothetical protein